MTQTQKDKMQLGRVNAKTIKKAVVKTPKPVKVTRVMSEEHKAKIQAGRAKAKLLNDSLPVELRKIRKKRVTKVKSSGKYNCDKITVVITGKEKDSYDFFAPIRLAYRSKKNYTGYTKLLKLISTPTLCNDIMWIKSQIAYECNLEIETQ